MQATEHQRPDHPAEPDVPGGRLALGRVADATPHYDATETDRCDAGGRGSGGRHRDIKVYVGLSAEGLANEAGTYLAREDYSPSLIKHVKEFNDRQEKFPWDRIEVERPPASAHHEVLHGGLT